VITVLQQGVTVGKEWMKGGETEGKEEWQMCTEARKVQKMRGLKKKMDEKGREEQFSG